MRTIVITSNSKELNEALGRLAEMFGAPFNIIDRLQEEPEENPEEKPESNHGKFVSLSAYEELEEILDDTIEERDKLERTNKFLQDKNNRLRELIAGFMIEVNKL